MNEVLPIGQRMMASIAYSLEPVTEKVALYLGENEFIHVPAFTAFFFQMFVTGNIFWRYIMRTNSKQTPLLASYGTSTIHALVLIAASWPELSTWTRTSRNLDLPNTPMQSLILEFSLAYMIFDFIYMVSFEPGDYLMLGHHILAGAYNAVALHLKFGAISAILPFFMGELSSPLFNIFNVSKSLRSSRAWAAKIFPIASTLFTFAFLLCRSVIGPPIMSWFVYHMLVNSSHIPRIWSIFMSLTVTIGMIGSQIWAFKLFRGWRKMISKRKTSEEPGNPS